MGTKSGIDGVLDVAVVSGGVGGSGNAAAGSTGSAVPSSADYLGFSAGGNLTGVSAASPLPVIDSTNYASPDGRAVKVQSNAAILFSDDFGGAAVDTVVRWDVIDGGLPANPTLHGKSLTQGAIGSGVTGMSDAVASSALTVTMGTGANAERWYLSQQAFAGAEDLLVILSKSQSIAANGIWIGLVEVDPTTLIPLYNANTPSYTINAQTVPFYFTNAGGVEAGLQTVNTSYATSAVGDSSGVAAAGSTATALAALTASSEFFIEFHAEDVIASNGAIDSVGAKNASPSRVSTQVPNDGKVYKLLMRFRNIGTPASSTTVTVQRILLWNSQEMRVEVTSGRGDQNPQKAVAVNFAGGTVLSQPTGTTTQSTPFLNATGTPAASTLLFTGHRFLGGQVWNTQASTWAWLKVYTTNPTMGTTNAAMNVGIPPNSSVNLADIVGQLGVYTGGTLYFALTGGAALNDATAISTVSVVGAQFISL